jgi:hypothetical protein
VGVEEDEEETERGREGAWGSHLILDDAGWVMRDGPACGAIRVCRTSPHIHHFPSSATL